MVTSLRDLYPSNYLTDLHAVIFVCRVAHSFYQVFDYYRCMCVAPHARVTCKTKRCKGRALFPVRGTAPGVSTGDGRDGSAAGGADARAGDGGALAGDGGGARVS